VEELEVYHDMTRPIVEGVRRSYDADRRVSGAEEYRTIGLRPGHIIFFTWDRQGMPGSMPLLPLQDATTASKTLWVRFS
jgi:hypothetical protein